MENTEQILDRLKTFVPKEKFHSFFFKLLMEHDLLYKDADGCSWYEKTEEMIDNTIYEDIIQFLASQLFQEVKI